MAEEPVVTAEAMLERNEYDEGVSGKVVVVRECVTYVVEGEALLEGMKAELVAIKEVEVT